jgi:hypothetical protein
VKAWFLRLTILFFLFNGQASWALPFEVPQEIQKQFLTIFPKSKFRMDGVLMVGEKIFVPIVPKVTINTATNLIEQTNQSDFLFANGWIYTPIENNSIKSFDYYPESFQKQILQSQIVQEFIIPKDFVLPRDLAMLAGRLPLKLKSVELASDRELLYKQRVKEFNQSKIFDFLGYSYDSRKLFNYSLVNSSSQSQTALQSEVLNEDLNLEQNFHYVSNIRKFGNIYITERNEAKIYEIKKADITEFNAQKPLEKLDVQNKKLKARDFISLADYGIKGQIEDFIVSADNKLAYILSSNINALIILNFQTRELIKVIDLPGPCMSLQVVSRSSNEPEQIMFFSRSKNMIYVVNSFDYRISQQIDLRSINQDFKFIPHDFLVNDQYIFVASEAISQDPKKNAVLYPKLLLLDVITGRFYKYFDLDSTPLRLLFIDSRQIAILSENSEGVADLKFFDAKNLGFASKLPLDVDFNYPKTFELNSTGDFLIVPSSTNPLFGIVDIKEKKLLKKISVNSVLQIIRSVD